MSDVEPLSIGWYSVADTFSADRYQSYTLRADAGRFESGYINFPAIYVLNESLDLLLQVGVDRLTDHSLDLGDLLVNGLSQLGLEVMSPADRNRRGASVTFAHPDAATIGSALAERDVHVWAGDGRVRASAHLFNDESDIECYLSVLEEVLRA
jgi:selenocysteine lyase/cysteine desulfurase